MNQIVPFNFESHEVRIVMRDDKPWAVAKDLAEAMEYRWVGTKTIQHVPQKWRGVGSVPTPSGVQEMALLCEEGWYFFVARSDKQKAIPFQEWLAGTVLPQIRKTGAYVPEGQNIVPGLTAELQATLSDATRTIKSLTLSLQGVHRQNMYLRKIEHLQTALDKKGSKMSADEIYTAKSMKHQGKTATEIARILDRSPGTVRRCLNGGRS